MNTDEVYRDKESIKSFSQLWGRRSVLLALSPNTPPPLQQQLLKRRDINLPCQQKRSWRGDYHYQHHHHLLSFPRGAGQTARTAPVSPVRSRARAETPRRQLTPTPVGLSGRTSAVKGSVICGTNFGTRPSCGLSAVVDGVGRTGVCAAEEFCRDDHNEVEGEEESDMKKDGGIEASLTLNSRCVSFSFTSGVSSRQQSRTRLSSSSPPPRATVIPSSFPCIYFSDNEEVEEGCGGVAGCQASAPSTLTPALDHGSTALNSLFEEVSGVDSFLSQTVSDVTEKAKSTNEERNENELMEVAVGNRGSIPLTSVAVIQTLGAAKFDTVVFSGLPVERGHLLPGSACAKRERSVPLSPSRASYVICGRASSSCRYDLAATSSADSEARTKDDDVVAEARRQKKDHGLFLQPLQGSLRSASMTGARESAMHISCDDVSLSTLQPSVAVAHSGGSLLLAGDLAQSLGQRCLSAATEEEPFVSLVVDVRCGDNADTAVSVAPLTDFFDVQTDWGMRDGRSADNGQDYPVADTSFCLDLRDSGTAKTAMVDAKCDMESGLVTTRPLCRPSDELVALIDSARSDLRHASEQLFKSFNFRQLASSDIGGTSFKSNKKRERSNDNTTEDDNNSNSNINSTSNNNKSNSNGKSLNDEGICDGAGGSLVRESTLLSFCHSPEVRRGNSNGRLWVPPETAILRRELAANAGRIMRRLRGYDSTDTGVVSMALVSSVLLDVLAGNSIDKNGGGADAAVGVASALPAGRGAWREARVAEEDAIRMYVSLWRCFREFFGERSAAKRLGVLDSEGYGGGGNSVDAGSSEKGACESLAGRVSCFRPWATCFPRLLQQLCPLVRQPPPLDTRVKYDVFVASLTELR